MSSDGIYVYNIKGESKNLADFVDKHVINGDFKPDTLGVVYPEYMDLENPYRYHDIIDEGIEELNIVVHIVYRRHFKSRSVEEDIFKAIKNHYPHLKVSYRELDYDLYYYSGRAIFGE